MITRLSSYTVWRIATVFAILVAAGALALAPFLFSRLDDAIETNKEAIAAADRASTANHNLTCAFADLVQLNRNPAPPHGTTAHLQAELDFLLTIRRGRCDQFERPAVAAALNQAIRDLRVELALRETTD